MGIREKRRKLYLLAWFLIAPTLFPTVCSWVFFSFQLEVLASSFDALKNRTLSATAEKKKHLVLATISEPSLTDHSFGPVHIENVEDQEGHGREPIVTHQINLQVVSDNEIPINWSKNKKVAPIKYSAAESLILETFSLMEKELNLNSIEVSEKDFDDERQPNENRKLAGSPAGVQEISVWEVGWDGGVKQQKEVGADEISPPEEEWIAKKKNAEPKNKKTVVLAAGDSNGPELTVGVLQGAEVSKNFVRGRVWGYGTEGETPLSRAKVGMMNTTIQAETDSNGSFTVKYALEGEHWLEYSHEDYLSAKVQVAKEDQELEVVLYSEDFFEKTYDRIVGFRNPQFLSLIGTLSGQSKAGVGGVKIAFSGAHQRIIYMNNLGIPDPSLEATSPVGMFYILNADKGNHTLILEYPNGMHEEKTLSLSDASFLYYLDI